MNVVQQSIGDAARQASSELAKERTEIATLHKKIGSLESENGNLLKRIAFIHDVSPATVRFLFRFRLMFK